MLTTICRVCFDPSPQTGRKRAKTVEISAPEYQVTPLYNSNAMDDDFTLPKTVCFNLSLITSLVLLYGKLASS